MSRVLSALILLAGFIAAVVIALTGPSAATPSSHQVEALFQDDDHLLYASTSTVTSTLDVLRGLGVDRLRVTVLWKAIAPDPYAASPPPAFNAADPAAYAPAAWAPYDRLVDLARARGIGVDFDLTAPGPLWAMARHAPAARYADHWAPSVDAFEQFVQAVGTRYSGQYHAAVQSAALPRVGFWSVWNEPNQPGWLAPQWQTVDGRDVMEAPALYRGYVEAAWRGLALSGHSPARDTILIGELAPEGSEGPSFDYRTPIPPMPFLRALYCVDGSYRPLRGAAAARLGCPQSGGPSAFVSAHPALFGASGFAHHPYSFFLAPNTSMPDANFAPLADLGRVERGLDWIMRAYGLKHRLPLWLTEYGYETDPPNPFRGVSPRLQSLYLNEAQYMAFRDPRVRGLSQFLLFDARPDTSYPPGSPGYWSTFQTGLLYAGGEPKPSLASYRLPLFLPDPVLGASRRVLLWAWLRPAVPGTRQTVSIQWRTQRGAYRTIDRMTVQNPGEVLVAEVGLPGPGVVRIAWRPPGSTVLYSRGSGVS